MLKRCAALQRGDHWSAALNQAASNTSNHRVSTDADHTCQDCSPIICQGQNYPHLFIYRQIIHGQAAQGAGVLAFLQCWHGGTGWYGGTGWLLVVTIHSLFTTATLSHRMRRSFPVQAISLLLPSLPGQLCGKCHRQMSDRYFFWETSNPLPALTSAIDPVQKRSSLG